MAVSMTLAPALMAVFGGLLFRPVPRRLRRRACQAGGRRTQPARPRRTWARNGQGAGTCDAGDPVRRHLADGPAARRGVHRWPARGRPAAARHPQLDRRCQRASRLVVQPRAQSAAAADGFAPGIVSPTDILVIGPGVAAQTAALARFQHELATQPGVAEIAGPATARPAQCSGAVPRPQPTRCWPSPATPRGSSWWRRRTRSTRPPSARSAAAAMTSRARPVRRAGPTSR